MSAATQVVTQDVLVLRRAPEEYSYSEAIFALAHILDEFEASDHELALQLHTWGVEALGIADEPAHRIAAAARIRIQALEAILVNPLNEAPLQEPLVDRSGWTWERAHFDDYLALSHLSPFDMQPLEAKPDLFTQAVIAWRQRLPREVRGESPATEEIQTLPHVGPSTNRVIYYTHAAQKAVERRRLRQEAAIFVQFTQEFKRQAKVAAEETEQNVARIEREAKAFSEELNQRVETIQRNAAEADGAHQMRTTALQEDLRSTRVQLEKQDRINEENRVRLSRLEQQLRDRQRELDALRGEMNGGQCIIL